MNAVSFFIPGSYEDAQLYMGSVILFGTDRSVRTFRFDQIIGQIESAIPGLEPLAQIRFLRNDWLSNPITKSYLSHAILGETFETMSSKFPSSFAVSLDHLQGSEGALALSDRTILDSQVYYRRLYLGTENGFYHVGLD